MGWPETLAVEVTWRLQAPVKLLGKIFGMLVPPVFGCRTASELTPVRVWDQNLPGRLLGARPTQTWIRPWQRRGQDLLSRRWQQSAAKRPAPRRRWQWTWVGDDSVCKKAGQQLGLVGTWDRGQEQRVRLGIDGRLLVVVIGEGQLVGPVDFVMRRPDPVGAGRPCRDKLPWLQVMWDRPWAVVPRRCRGGPAPGVVAARWFGESPVLAPVASGQQGLWRVEGQRRSVFHRRAGRRVTGEALRTLADGPWRDRPPGLGRRDARLTATSATDGRVTRVLVDKPGAERFSGRCQETPSTAPRLIRAWSRRRWIEPTFRPRTHLLAPEAGQAPTEDADYGHLVLRLVAGLVWLYTARFGVKSRVTMAAIVCSLNQPWRFLTSEPLEIHALSWDRTLRAA